MQHGKGGEIMAVVNFFKIDEINKDAFNSVFANITAKNFTHGEKKHTM